MRSLFSQLVVSLMLGLALCVGTVVRGELPRSGVVKAIVGTLRDTAYGLALQPDGKILVAGATFNGVDNNGVVLRFLSDGTLDANFGDGGATILDGKRGDDKAFAVAVRWDGKIYVAGQVFNGRDTDFALWRLLPSGKIDKRFGKDGLAKADFGKGDDVGLSIVLQVDGKVVIAGNAMGAADKDFALAKFLGDGSPDLGFGLNGKLITSLGDIQDRSGDESSYSTIVQPDGGIIQVGFSEVRHATVMSVVRYLNDARLDPTFGKRGSLFPSFPGKQTRAYSAALDRKGRILLAGCAESFGKREFAIVRALSDGTIDTAFGTNGMAIVPLPSEQSTIYGIDVDSNGRMVVAGASGDGSRMDLVVARLLENGMLDPSFAQGGKQIFPGSGKYDAAYALAIQPDSKIVVAGVTTEGTGYQVVLLRYRETGELDTFFGGGSRALQSVDPNQKNLLPKGFSLPGLKKPAVLPSSLEQ